jgi:hypothetical protein
MNTTDITTISIKNYTIIYNITCEDYQNTKLAVPYCRNNMIVTFSLTSLVTVCAVGVLLKSFMIKERIFFVTTLSLLIVGMIALALLIWL